MLIVVSNVKIEKVEIFSSTYSSELNCREEAEVGGRGGVGESFSCFGEKLLHSMIRVN